VGRVDFCLIYCSIRFCVGVGCGVVMSARIGSYRISICALLCLVGR